MNRVRDFIMMDVFNINGDKVGEIKDIALNYYESKVIGFEMIPNGFSKNNFIYKEYIISIINSVIVDKVTKQKELCFKDIRGMEIIDKDERLIGIVEDILIDIVNFDVKGIIVSSGFFQNFFNGKSVILLKDTILGDENILFIGKSKMQLISTTEKDINRGISFDKK